MKRLDASTSMDEDGQGKEVDVLYKLNKAVKSPRARDPYPNVEFDFKGFLMDPSPGSNAGVEVLYVEHNFRRYLSTRDSSTSRASLPYY